MWLRLSRCLSNAAQARADAASIAFRADCPHCYPIISSSRIAAQKLGIIVHRVDYHVDIAVVVKISESAATGSDRLGDARSALHRDIFEAAVSQVSIEQLALRISGFGFELLDFWIYMPVTDQDVWPAIVVHIKKSAAPAKVLRVRAEAGGKSWIFKIRAAEVVIKRRRVAREISFNDIEIAVHIVVSRGDFHARLRLAIGTEGASGFQRDVHKLAVLLVLVKRTRVGVIRNIDIGPAIVIEISGQHA